MSRFPQTLPARIASYAGIAAVALVFGAGCGGDDTTTVEPTSSAPPQAAASGPTISPAAGTLPPTATVALTPSEDITNELGVKFAVVKVITSDESIKLTLPALPENIDKLDISDAFGAGNTVLRIGIVDGVVLAPADTKVMKIEKIADTPLGADSVRVTLRLPDGNGTAAPGARPGLVYLWAAGDSVVQAKEGEPVLRNSPLISTSRRLEGSIGAGYSAVIELATASGQNRLSFNAGAGVGGKPASYVRGDRLVRSPLAPVPKRVS